MSNYSISENKFWKKEGDSIIPLKAFGCTLYPAHSYSRGAIERCITEGIKNGNHTLFRMVLIFEGFKGENVLKASGWKSVTQALQLAQKYNVGITVELGSSLISYLERKNENPYDPQWNDLFKKVFNFRKCSNIFRR